MVLNVLFMIFINQNQELLSLFLEMLIRPCYKTDL